MLFSPGLNIFWLIHTTVSAVFTHIPIYFVRFSNSFCFPCSSTTPCVNRYFHFMTSFSLNTYINQTPDFLFCLHCSDTLYFSHAWRVVLSLLSTTKHLSQLKTHLMFYIYHWPQSSSIPPIRGNHSNTKIYIDKYI